MKKLPASSAELAVDGYANRIALRLDEGIDGLPHHVIERLRAGRMQALSLRKKQVLVRKPASVLTRLGASLALGGGGSGGWWHSLLAAVPMLALVAGIMVLGADQDETGTLEIAEVDAALLASDLPPAAYADPGFVQFLKTRTDQSH